MKKLFVGNLSWKATEDSLKQHFEAFGEVVSAKIVLDQYTGKSKGFGFVEMANAEAAQNAINALNDKDYLSRPLRVSFAQERPRDFNRQGGGGSGGSRDRGDRGDRGGRGGDRGEQRYGSAY